MKDELGRKIMKGFRALKPELYCYLTYDEYVDKKARCRKKYVIKREIKFVNYKNCLENN